MLGCMPLKTDDHPQAPEGTLKTRQLWRIAGAGSLSRLRLVEEALSPPGPGEVQVAIHAVGVNFADIFACLGLYSATPQGSFVPGLEAAGVVVAVAADVSDWRPGDRVIVLTRFGGYASALNVPAATLWPIPLGWSYAEAAAYPVQALTAWYGIEKLGNARRDSVVLVQSAAGGVGIHAMRALLRLGAKPVAVVGRSSKRHWLINEFGLPPATVVLRDDRYAASLDAALQHWAARGFDLVFDAVYGKSFAPAYARLAAEGRYVLYGAADFMNTGARANPLKLLWGWLRRPRLDPLAMIPQNRGLLAFNLIWLWEQAERLPDAMRATLALIPERPTIGACYAFDNALAAMQSLQSGNTTGKLVLTVTQPDEPQPDA